METYEKQSPPLPPISLKLCWSKKATEGEGGPWKNSSVKPNEPSDPYLIGFYDNRSLSLSHDSKQAVTFQIQVEPIGHGPWMGYKTVTVKPEETINFIFPEGFQSRWIRFVVDKDCKATAWLIYR